MSSRTPILAIRRPVVPPILLFATMIACGRSRAPDRDPVGAPRADIERVLQRISEVGAHLADAPKPMPELGAGSPLRASGSDANAVIVTPEDLAELGRASGTAPGAEAELTAAGRRPALDLHLATLHWYLQAPTTSPSDSQRAQESAAWLAGIHYVVVARETSSYVARTTMLSRHQVSIWDLDAGRWLGTLWVSMELLGEGAQTLVQVNREEQPVGQSFRVAEGADVAMRRHQQEITRGIEEALASRRQVWQGAVARNAALPFAPERERTYEIAIPKDSPALGPADAAVVVQIFGELGDPSLRELVAHIDQVFGDRVRVVWRNYPLDFHPQAEPAAEAALEVLAQGGVDTFWRYFDALASHPDLLSEIALERDADQIGGIDGTRLRDALARRTHRSAIRADVAALKRSGLPDPAVAAFVNGWALNGVVDFGAFENAIRYALENRRP